MKTHLIKHISSAECDYVTTTYCGLCSEEWSEKFSENVNETLTQNVKKCSCKKCIIAYRNELVKFGFNV